MLVLPTTSSYSSTVAQVEEEEECANGWLNPKSDLAQTHFLGIVGSKAYIGIHTY